MADAPSYGAIAHALAELAAPRQCRSATRASRLVPPSWDCGAARDLVDALNSLFFFSKPLFPTDEQAATARAARHSTCARECHQKRAPRRRPLNDRNSCQHVKLSSWRQGAYLSKLPYSARRATFATGGQPQAPMAFEKQSL